MVKIARFIFNFRHVCNMNCPYCYIPFVDKSSGTITLWKAIIDKIASFSPDIVTFGGGDPFAYEDFAELIKYCDRYSFQVQIDTNAIGLTKEIIKDIHQHVSIIGVPLDGDSSYHDSLRKYRGHHSIVCNAIDALSEFNIPVKLNTVMLPQNVNQLYNIAKEVQFRSNIKQWFIYEYWHFSDINKPIPSENPVFDFANEYSKLKDMCAIDSIHYSTVSERSPAYIFVSSLGNLYTVDSTGQGYVELANIFDKDADKILTNIRNIEQIQKRTTLKQI